MEITIAESIWIGVWAAIALAGTLLGNYTATPIVYSLGVGIILKDIQTAVIIGAAGQTVFLGFGISPGGVRPPEPIAPGIFATVIAIVEKRNGTVDANSIYPLASAFTLVATSVAVGILMQVVITALFTAMAPFSQMAKKAVLNNKMILFKIYSNLTIFLLMAVGFIFGLLVGLSASGIGQAAKNIPTWLRTGLRVGGGMLPALGFALILKVMLKKEYFGFVFLGYFLTVVFDAIARITNTSFSVIGLTIAAISIILIILNIKKLANIKEAIPISVNQTKGNDQDGI